MWHFAEESPGIKIGWVDGKLVWDTNLKVTILSGFIVHLKTVAFDIEDSVHQSPCDNRLSTETTQSLWGDQSSKH